MSFWYDVICGRGVLDTYLRNTNMNKLKAYNAGDMNSDWKIPNVKFVFKKGKCYSCRNLSVENKL